MRKFKTAVIFIFILSQALIAQGTFRIMTYNILNYPVKISSTRNPYFKKILSSIEPDILVVQEVENYSGVTQFLQQVLDSNYSAGAFIDGFDTDNALFYKDSVFEFIENTAIRTSLRNISQLRLVHRNSGDTLLVYSVHLKASSGSINEQKRLDEVSNLRAVTDQLPQGTYFLVLGDFNMYSSSEPAFQKLIDQSNPGYFIDPISRLGNWNESVTFRGIHTQSTRTENLADEGSTGGLDDRFDLILVSQAVKDTGGITYVPGSYTTFGNDGNHLNRAMNELPNAVVDDDIAIALYYSSDHLPVYADFSIEQVTAINSSEINFPEKMALSQNYPNPFNPATKIGYTLPISDNLSYVELKIFDILGREVADLVSKYQKSGSYNVTWNAGIHPSGIYIYTLSVNGSYLSKKMLLLK